ncbi:Degradation activator [Raoultella terrigena]|uniref:Degradation activator n=1 Tax=Raoultella terrigena TaxID=577 RepID=A0A485CRC5_RAOTE|nr:Degradation activator [Raoultella terrigena]
MAKAARATISDVAKAAKTGKTSISRYLNGEKHLLSDDLLARIEKAIAELNYRPSLMARGLKHGRTRLIGLIIADITNPYSVNVLSGIEAACREKGFTLLVCNTNNELDQELHYLDLLRSYQVEGIVVNAVGMREEGLNRLQQSALPMVLIDRKIPDFACDVVGLDNTQARHHRHRASGGKRLRGAAVSERAAGLRQHAARAAERLSHHPSAPRRGSSRKMPKSRSTTARCWTACCASFTPAIAGCAKRLSPPTAP